MQLTEVQLRPGIKSVESKLGIRNGQVAAPDFVLSLDAKAKETEGRVLFGTLAWSGGFANTFEIDLTNRLRILSGINSYASEWHLRPGEIFETPKFLFTFSTQGKGEASRRFHRWARLNGVRDGYKPQPTLLNNWEATGFNFDQARIESLYQGANAAGIEIFLLDDGWFGNGKYARVTDAAGLGDWQPNLARFPHGLEPLVRSALDKRLQFGIWMEPEMVNPTSRLYTRHPEWVITQPHRPASLFRNQLVLDLTRPEVQEFVSRVKIQWGYSHFYPAEAISAHVTRMSNRPFKFAFDVAMSGRLGMDVDTGTLTAEELAVTRQAVSLYKSELRDVVQFGDLYRLESPYEGSRASLDSVARDKTKAVAFAWQLEGDAASGRKPLTVAGLKPDFSYLVKEVNLKPGTTSRLPGNGQTFRGAQLMSGGIALGFEKQFDSATIELIAN